MIRLQQVDDGVSGNRCSRLRDDTAADSDVTGENQGARALA
jgi:hypothetical protein